MQKTSTRNGDFVLLSIKRTFGLHNILLHSFLHTSDSFLHTSDSFPNDHLICPLLPFPFTVSPSDYGVATYASPCLLNRDKNRSS